MGVENHRPIRLAAQALSVNGWRSSFGPQKLDLESPGLKQAGQVFGIDFHIAEIGRGVGQGHQVGELVEDLDLVLRPIGMHCIANRLSAGFARIRGCRAQHQNRSQRTPSSKCHIGPSPGILKIAH
jgi:hypothetical protein